MTTRQVHIKGGRRESLSARICVCAGKEAENWFKEILYDIFEYVDILLPYYDIHIHRVSLDD